MTASRHWPWLLQGRRGFLIGVLAAAVVVLLFRWADLALAYRFSVASSAIRSRDFRAAIVALERSQSRGVSSAQWHFLLGRAHRRAGELLEAESHISSAQRLGWHSDEIERQRLLAKAQSGHIKEVEAELISILSAGATDEEAEEMYEAMARGYLASFHLSDANRCLQFWVKFQPQNPLPHLWLGEMYTHLEDTNAAAREFSTVLALNPAHLEARLKLAQSQLNNLEVEDAANNFERCLSQSPDSPEATEAMLGLVECRRRQGATEASVSLLYDALIMELPPVQEATALSTLGRIDLEERRFSQAIQSLDRSISLDPYDPASRLAMASALAAVGQDQLAAAHRDNAREIADRRKRLVELTRHATEQPGNADIRCEAGLLLCQLGRSAAGAEWLKTAVTIVPGHQAAHQGLAAYYRQIGDNQAAQRHQALAGKPPARDAVLGGTP